MDKTLPSVRTPTPLAAIRQRGVTLIISVVLLLLLSVIVLLATNVGLQEQRTSGNDFRAKLTHDAAEAALNFAGEYFKQNVGNLRPAAPPPPPAPALWTPCAGATTFPCGVLLNAAGNPQANTLFYTGNVPLAAPFIDTDGNGTLDGLNVGGFTATVQVGAVMCRVDVTAPPAAPACTANAGAPGSSVLSMVARAQIPGEGSSTTLVQSITAFSKLNTTTNTPPIAASGSIGVAGSLDLVTNPNGAGTGVPVSVWTRLDVSGNGTPNTCYLDEFIRFGSTGGATPRFCTEMDDGCTGDNANVMICDACRCTTGNSLSFNPPGGGGLAGEGEGIDLLDVDGNIGTNKDVRPNEFPCDLFEFVFGVKARNDTNGDFFCETLIKTADPDDSTKQIGVDELFLRENANVIVDGVKVPCTVLNKNSRGLIWVKDIADCSPNNQVGTVDAPVVLVVDRDADFQGGFRLFGVLFVRATADPLLPATGGNAELKFNGRGAIYGAAVVQGVIGNPTGGPGLTGTAAFIHNETVLTNLVNLPELQAFGTMPGSWTDRFSY